MTALTQQQATRVATTMNLCRTTAIGLAILDASLAVAGLAGWMLGVPSFQSALPTLLAVSAVLGAASTALWVWNAPRQTRTIEAPKPAVAPPNPPAPAADGDLSRHPQQSLYADDPQMGELLQQFSGFLADYIHQIENSASQNDLTGLASVVHKVRGSGGGYGYPAISEAAGRLDESLRVNQPDEIGVQVQELIGLCQGAIAGINAGGEPCPRHVSKKSC
ncbi:MAG: Hpt domain-containing protein [Planctomycetes bacterium]|nr:Hpt domain-containing protein [Planctomycetota bacterium]